MIVLIDNYDSFTYNIAHYLEELNATLRVVLNDEYSAQDVLSLNPSGIVLGPGPGKPEESGVSLSVLKMAAESGTPVLGICLGHELIAEAFGGKVVSANSVMHGKVSKVEHSGTDVFEGIAQELSVARYHSLVVSDRDFPEDLVITARVQSDTPECREIMGLAHKSLPIYGFQFHPESVLTEHGHQLLNNFINMTKLYQKKQYDVLDIAV